MPESFLTPNTRFFLVKDERAYDVSFLAEAKEVLPRHVFAYTFRVSNYDEAEFEDHHVLLTNILHAEKGAVDCAIIAI